MQLEAFASKVLLSGKSLFKREHGVRASLSSGSNDILFTVPYAWVKMIGVEVIGGELGDYVDFYVLDSSTGTYSGTANYTLNQFGFEVNIAPDEYEENSSYDADLYIGMQLKLVYHSVSAKQVGVNFNLNEVK